MPLVGFAGVRLMGCWAGFIMVGPLGTLGPHPHQIVSLYDKTFDLMNYWKVNGHAT